MLESIRKYQWLMIAVFILLAAGFLFTFNDFGAGAGGRRNTALSVDGRSYDTNEYKRLGSSSIELASNMNFIEMIGFLGENPYRPNKQKFIVNRLIVQKEAEKLGLYPSDETVADVIKNSIFAKDGNFDAQAYNDVTSRLLPALGLGERDLVRLVSDKLALDKLVNVIAGELSPPETFAAAVYQDNTQQLTLQRFEFPFEGYKKDLSPVEDEVKAYWAENTLDYMAPVQFKVKYVLEGPDYPEAAEGDEPDTAARALAERAVSEKVDLFWENLNTSDGADFDEKAAAAGLTVKTTEWFSRDSMPTDLSLPLNGGNGSIANSLSAIQEKATGMALISDPLPLADKRWIVFQRVENKPTEPLSFEAARDSATEDYIAKLAKEAAEKAAANARTALSEALAAGTDFDSAIADLEAKPTKLGPFKVSDRLPNEYFARNLFDQAKRQPVGSVTEVIDDGNRALFSYVVAREIEKSEDMSEMIANTQTQATLYNRIKVVTNWLSQKTEEAGVKSAITQ